VREVKLPSTNVVFVGRPVLSYAYVVVRPARSVLDVRRPSSSYA
jgi:hypothetical protein